MQTTNNNKPVKILWQVELRKILDANKTRHAIKDKTVSTRTKDNRHDVLFQSFTELRDICKCKLDNPRNFREKHFEALLKLWLSKKLSPSSLQGKTSVLRTFCTWIGRPNMIADVHKYSLRGLRAIYVCARPNLLLNCNELFVTQRACSS
jgi:site-specific recombinase XerD